MALPEEGLTAGRASADSMFPSRRVFDLLDAEMMANGWLNMVELSLAMIIRLLEIVGLVVYTQVVYFGADRV